MAKPTDYLVSTQRIFTKIELENSYIDLRSIATGDAARQLGNMALRKAEAEEHRGPFDGSVALRWSVCILSLADLKALLGEAYEKGRKQGDAPKGAQ